MFTFIFRHPIAVLIALLIHVFLFVLLVIVPQNKQEVIKIKLVSSTETSDAVKTLQPMKTFAVDSKQVQMRLAKIKEEEQQKIKRQQQLVKQTASEKKRLDELKRKKKIEQKKFAIEKKKAQEAKRLAKIEKQKEIALKKRTKVEEKKAEKAKKEAKLAEKKRLEAKKKVAQAEKKRKKAEEKSKKIALEIKKRNAEKEKLEVEALQARLIREQEEEEALLQKQIAEEDSKKRKVAREKEMQNLREVYISNIASAVKLNWKTVARISEKAECIISITQTPKGNISSVKVHDCNKYATQSFKKDAEKAVFRSQPLPKPPVKELFERKIDFIFKP